jgi:AcrR family transcriptional regulator
MSARDRRLSLIELAIDIVGKDGVDALRVERLATAAGVSRPVVYEHFGDRHGLLVAVTRQLVAEIAAATIPVELQHDQDLPSMLRATTHAYIDVVARRGAALRALVLSDGFAPDLDAERRTLMTAPTGRWVKRCQDYAGLSKADAEVVVRSQLASLFSIAEQWTSGRISRRRAEHIFVTTALAGLDALRTAPPTS